MFFIFTSRDTPQVRGTGLFAGGCLTLRLRRTTVRRQAPARQPPTKMLSVS